MNALIEFTQRAAPQPLAELLNNPQEKPVLCLMERHSVIEIEGPDCFVFLQGQVTCDVRDVEKGQHLLGAHCNNKGRMMSSFVASKIGEQKIGLRLRADLLPEALSQLEKYIVFSKATVRQAEVTCVSLFDPSPALIESIPQSSPNNGVIHQLHHKNFSEVWLDTSEAHCESSLKTLESLAEQCAVASPDYFDYRMIGEGIAEVQAVSREQYIPQEFNYQLIDGVSFKKGCYTGQEIVARMQYRGKLKKHLYRIAFSCDDSPQVGDKLIDDEGKTQAEIACCVYTNNSYQALVVANLSAVSNDRLQIAEKNLSELKWLDLPYAIPND